ncbi:HAD-IA family hydrolase [Psychrobacter sp.]|uniref:HAD family hydrolase n=1 Tax=Psychrobacter sp. TaxID=56811 RepID=UPI003F9DAE2A
MNILLYTNPFLTRNKLDFYSGAINKKLIPQALTLLEHNNEVTVFLNRASYEQINRSHSGDIKFIVVEMTDQFFLENVSKDIEKELYLGNSDYVNKLSEWFLLKLNGNSFDCVIGWETPINFIEKSLPKATVISEMPGFLSRVPYPELYTFDTYGLFKDSQITTTDFKVDSNIVHQANELLELVRHQGAQTINKITPFSRAFLDPDDQYKCIHLMPLQVLGQYAFDVDSSYNSLSAQIIDTLQKLPSNHGLVITKYVAGGFDGGIDNDTISYIKEQYPNLIYFPIFELLDNVSQYLLPNVDTVITLSSSIGVQALLFNKPLIALNSIYFSKIADYDCIESFLKDFQLGGLLLESISQKHDNKLKWILSYHQPLAKLLLHDSEFLSSLIFSKVRKDGKSFFEIFPDYISAFKRSFKCDKAIKDIEALTGLVDSTCGINTEQKFFKTVSDLRPELISFDIFDTLLERTYEQPSHLFKAIESEVERITLGSIKNFSNIRSTTERNLRTKIYKENGCQDVTLKQIYNQIALEQNVDDEIIQVVLNLELQYELKSLRVRNIGKKLFEIAKDSGSKVILISDMYLPKDFLLQVISREGFNQFSDFYLSCDVGLRKHEGDLYDYVCQQENVDPRRWLHIGDNPHGDIKMAEERGINVFHIKSSFVTINENKKLGALIRQDKRTRNILESLIYGTIQSTLFDKPFDRYSNITHSGGSAKNVGFIALGPLLLGYLTWLMKDAKKEGIEKLYFLARDGKILYQMCEILFPESEGWPARDYILSSRRSALVAGIYSTSDIIDLLDSSVAPNMTVERLFASKFGIRLMASDSYKLKAFGLQDVSHKINMKYDRENIRSFALSMSKEILSNAKKERDLLIKYYTDKGLNDGKVALIDIGYAGTMQAALYNILDNEKINGYYFITFEKAMNNVKESYFMKAYTENFVKPHLSKELISNNGFFYETLFCSSDHSFIKFETDEYGSIMPIYDVYSDMNRRSMIKEVHHGVLDFCTKMSVHFPLPTEHLFLEPAVASRIFNDLLKNPSGLDAGIFEGIEFDDGFAGAGVRYIVAPRQNFFIDKEKAINSSIWKQGAAVFSRRPDIFENKVKSQSLIDTKDSVNLKQSNLKPGSIKPSSTKPISAKPEAAKPEAAKINSVKPSKKIFPKTISKKYFEFEEGLVKKLSSTNKFRKYKRDRVGFFSDSKKVISKTYLNITDKV